MKSEIFRSTEHDGYEVSNLGRVARKGRWAGNRWLEYSILHGSLFNNGYLYVTLSGHKKVAIHRLVAAAFCTKDDARNVVNHKDGNKLNNRPENLEWVTQGENTSHAYHELGVAGSCKGKYSDKHPTAKSVVSICMKTGAETVYPSGMDAVRAGYRSDSISRACRGLIAHHAGHYWKYLHATAVDRGINIDRAAA